MRRPLFALTLAAVALAAAACSASTPPGWTYAPPTPSPSAAPSSSASAAPGGSASAGPSDGGSSAAPSGGAAGGTVVQISALNIAFEQTSVSAPADVPFTIHFNNKEAVPHNVDVKDAGGAEKFKGDLVTGPKEVDYQVPALAAGDYTFTCIVHPNMTGKLKVGG
ncbi:MAG TPA: cupredoxin domain-containing protein [Candidatus Limnocylindrales bacterium]|jgi:plastocyanin